MKTPDPSSEAYRAGARSELALAEPGPGRSEEREDPDFEPKYLSMPMRRPRGQGRRNLVVGVALLFLSALLFGWALFLAGPGAAYTVAGALATGAALYVVARSRLLRQRNGVFVAGGIVCLLGVLLVLVQQAWILATNPAAHVAAAVPSPAPAVAPPAAKPAPLPALVEAFKPEPAELESGAIARVRRAINVEVDRKLYRLRVGDLLPVAGRSRDEVRLAAGAQEVAVPASAVDVAEPADAPPARPLSADPARTAEPTAKEAEQLTARSHQEAMKKYPALAVKGSPENEHFVEAYRELKFAGGARFFDDPEWPMRLANQLAAREGWDRPKGAAPPEDDPAPAPEPSAAPDPTAPPLPASREP